MLITLYILTGISAVLGLGVGVLGCLLSSLFIGSISDSDKWIGGLILIISLLYIAHPLIAIRLIKVELLGWCSVYSLVFISISIGLCVFLFGAIEAAARP